MALNNVVLMGRLTRDIEVRQTQNGISVASFTLAVDKPYNKENEHPEANFIDAVAWRQTAEFLSKWFSKGSRIIIEGSIQTRSYEDKDGNKRKVTEVLVDRASFVDKKSDYTSGDTSYDTSISEDINEDSDSDLPF